MNYTEKSVHIPVLLQASLAQIQPKKGESYLDFTAGYGGHAGEFLNITKNFEDSVLVDRDENAICTLQRFKNEGVGLLHMDFLSAAREKGLVRMEGKEYVMQDGDVVLFRFNV